ncbi:hemicentin-1-like [Limulus polyphemus]|uniref:Hemicentin-1-like n=1 Tax=Limulus polyphemus TaxID=6850 RepID=A0ABM1T548_LIMPO|nr:hemicentin-1-like [Limulus polyphemus]
MSHKVDFLLVFMQLFSSIFATKTTVIFGLVDEDVKLPCNITATLPHDKPALVLWYKDKLPTPIYTLDSRIGPLWQARHSSSDGLATRAYLTTVNRPATLVISQVKKEDEGSYRCRVDFNRARTRYTDSVLKVIVPPSKLIIKDHQRQPLKSLIGPYNEGEPLFLTCEVQGGSPMPSVTWWRESVLLDDNYSLANNGFTVNELVIPRLRRHDLMADFTCCASNTNLSTALSSTVTLDMNFRPLLLEMEGGQQPLSAGTPTKLNCHSAGSRPPVAITWWKGFKELRTARTTVSNHGNSTISTLIFTPMVEDDNQILACVAENKLMPRTTLREERKLNVHYAPLASLWFSGNRKSGSVREGSDVYFECLVQSNPEPVKISWMFEGKELQASNSMKILVHNYTLTVKEISRSSRGRYSCTATNSEGKGESGIFFHEYNLRVQYAPMCKTKQIRAFGVPVHESIRIDCEVDAEPPDVTFRWIFNNTHETFDVVDYENHLTRSRATFIPRSIQDYGVLFCSAENEVGPQVSPCVFTITPVGPPEKPRDCMVRNVTMYSIQIACEEGFNGGLKQHFVLEIYDKNLETREINITSEIPVFLIQDLSYETPFEVIVYAMNSEGKSENWVMTINTLSNVIGHDESHWSFPFGPLFVIIGTSFVAVTAVVLVIIILIHVRQSRRKPNSRQRDVSTGSEERFVLKNSTDGFKRTTSHLEEDTCPDIIPMSLHQGSETSMDGEERSNEESVFLARHSISKTNTRSVPYETPEPDEKYTYLNIGCSSSTRSSPPSSSTTNEDQYHVTSSVPSTTLRRIVCQKGASFVSKGATTNV